MGDRRDPRHDAVRRVLRHQRETLVVPAAVTAEVDYLIRQRGGRAPSRRFLDDIASGRFRVECLTQQEHLLALGVDDRYAALDLGLADLSVIVLAFRFHTRQILTFDNRHFRPVKPLQGDSFTLLPQDD